MHLNVHCGTVHNSQDMEATKMFINRGMDKEDVVHIYNLMLLNIKKNEIMPWMDLESVILSEVSQTQKNYCMTPVISGI